MRVEFLRAFDDNTWDTVTVTVPDSCKTGEEIVAWGYEQDQSVIPTGLVLLAVYNIRPE
ncbi:MAG: hypothetical protein GF334_10285 [Candidatus Altiarchaeales archaeon]|nr:hypothetical protein [Candidatus Altiarchaeales archaeon]